MKIRNGFVSNSSSSSFAIIGTRVCLNESQINELVNYYGIKDADDMEYYERFEAVTNAIESEIKEQGLDIEAVDSEDESFYIGIVPVASQELMDSVTLKIKSALKNNPHINTDNMKVSLQHGEYNY